MSTRKGTKGFLLGALAGGVIGSITALLLAPKPGKELRQDISAGAQRMGDTTLKAAGKVSETTGRIAKGIGDQAAQIADRGKQAAGNVASAVRGFRRSGAGEDANAIATISNVPDALDAAAAKEESDSATFEADANAELKHL